MQIIISPAKKMKHDLDGLPPVTRPVFQKKTGVLLEHLRGLSYPALRALLACNDPLATLNYERFQRMDLEWDLTPSLLSYEGIQYRYMAPRVFTVGELEYVQARLRILSGFYGVLRPLDGVCPYRLEMQAKLKTDFCSGLYDFWGGELAGALEPDGVLLNLASAEYSRAVLPHLAPEVQVVTPVFGERNQVGRIIEKGIYVKMARGEMVRFLAEREAQGPEEMLDFDRLGFRYHRELSEKGRPVFLRGE